MDEEFKLSRFEQEFMRHLRALPFAMQQHISRYVLRLEREQNKVPTDDREKTAPGETPPPLWNMAPDEIAQLRKEIRDQQEREGE